MKIGYVIKSYPRFSQTFIVNEILAHEAAGLDIEIFSLRPAREEPRHASVGRVRARVTYLPPAAAVGRWSLLALPKRGHSPTERLKALAEQLLGRHGVLTRDAIAFEAVPGGFPAVYPVLRTLEEAGRIRRGYFVAGRGATQFALAGAVERLRARRDTADVPSALVIAATDPANPYGAALPWPEREGGRKPMHGRCLCRARGRCARRLARPG